MRTRIGGGSACVALWGALGVALVGAACGGGEETAVDGAVAADSTLDAAAGSATLSALTVSSGVIDPPFEPSVTVYDLDLRLVDDSVAFVPTAANPGATITVDGVTVTSAATSAPIALAAGSRDLVIAVVSGDESIAYTFHVHRGVDALTSLAPTPGSVSPAFAEATTEYTVSLPLSQPTVTITPTLLIPDRASMSVDGVAVDSGSPSMPVALVTGANDATVTVTPLTQPPRTTTLTMYRGSDSLASIQLSRLDGVLPNRLAPAFDPATNTYAVDLGLWVQRLQLEVTPIDPGASLTVAGGPVSAGIASTPVDLNLGLTTIPIVVTAPDATQRTYTLNVTRGSQALQQAYAKASNPDANDQFGAVALWGDTLVVGALREDSSAIGIAGNQADNSATDSGAVYVFTRAGAAWTQQAYIKASNASAEDYFGWSVAVWGDTLAVSAPFESSNATGIDGDQANNSSPYSGAVYVFTRTGTTWSQQAYVKASNAGPLDYFGWSMALSGDTLAVGAWSEDGAATGVNGDQNGVFVRSAGAAYVFTRTGTTWSQQAYIKASNTDVDDYFGQVVALWGDTLVVGAPQEDSSATGRDGDQADNAAVDSGAAYVFTRSDTTWSQQAYLKASNTAAGDCFGCSMSVAGDTIALGAGGEDSSATGHNGNQADNSASNAGAVYVWKRVGTSWFQEAYLKASNSAAGDGFGATVAVWGDRVAVGAGGEDSSATGVGGNQGDNSTPDAGAVYVFTAPTTFTTWSQLSYLKASNPGPSDGFGGIALWGDTLAVGTGAEDSAAPGIGGNQADNSAAEAGAVYVFR